MRTISGLVIVFLYSTMAIGQTEVPNTFETGQPARAAEVNANFDALENAADANSAAIDANSQALGANSQAIDANATAVQQNASSISDNTSAWTEADQAVLDQVGEADLRIITRIREVEMQFRRAFDTVFNCGEFVYYGCTTATSISTGLVLDIPDNAWRFGQQKLILKWRGPDGRESFQAVSIDGSISSLWIGGHANVGRANPNSLVNPFLTPALVDDCDNPTLELVMIGELSSRHLRANDGWIYEAEPLTPVGPVDVTGQLYGVINRRLPEVPDQDPPCTMVNDKIGFYEAYALSPLIDIAAQGTDWMLQ